MFYRCLFSKQVLVLLNVVQDQSMKDEGLAREAINLVQKLRKEAHVTPSDAVTVYYEVQFFLKSFLICFSLQTFKVELIICWTVACSTNWICS